jgi:hypothetical protein
VCVPEGHQKLAGGEASAASGNHRKNVPIRIRPERAEEPPNPASVVRAGRDFLFGARFQWFLPLLRDPPPRRRRGEGRSEMGEQANFCDASGVESAYQALVSAKELMPARETVDQEENSDGCADRKAEK